MVWHVGYSPTEKFPGIKFVSGSFSEVRVIDLDPGEPELYQPAEAAFRYGRRISAPGIPVEAEWRSNSSPDDYFTAHGIPFVSERLREGIEKIEPEVHQFLPLILSKLGGSGKQQYWYWVVGNRFDTVDRDRTNLVLYRNLIWLTRDAAERATTRSPEPVKIVFTSEGVGHAQFWRDAFMRQNHLFISRDAVRLLEPQGFTGISFAEREVF